MNALIKKEFRLLMPGLFAGLLIVGAIWLLPQGREPFLGPNVAECSLLACSVLLLTLGAFGREFSSGNFSMLLAQPVSRLRIWWTKTSMLAVMVTLVWCIWYINWSNHHLPIWYSSHPQHTATPREMGVSTMLFAMAMYAGGLWSVLLFRQVAAAFWFTVLTPAALWMSTANLLEHQSHALLMKVLIVVFIVYGVGGFLFAGWLFFTAQDVQWTGGNIWMPEVRGLAWFKVGTGARRRLRPRMGLLMKEFQLHQAQYVIAGVLVLLHLGVLATRKFGSFQVDSPAEFVLTSFWIFWLVMPLLIGCAAVAEERKMGTLEGQLCMPAKRRTQFALKFFVVILSSVVLGAVVPLLLEGNRILPKYGPDSYAFNSARYFLMISGFWDQFAVSSLPVMLSNLSLLIIVAFSAVTAAVAFYVSTFVRNTLQALAPAVLGILLAGFLLYAVYLPEEYIGYPLWRGPLIYLIAVPVMAVVMVLLAYWNYKRFHPGWAVLRKNLLAAGAAGLAIVLCTTTIYNRAWELLGPIEPSHGAGRLTPNQTRLRVDRLYVTVILSDGRAWIGSYYDFAVNASRKGKFLDGSNWIDAIAGEHDIAGIQRDGSLWVSEKSTQGQELYRAIRQRRGIMDVSRFTKLVRMGNENDWKEICAYSPYNGQGQFLLKKNGTLWWWGRQESMEKWQGLRSFTPRQLGTDSDWETVFMTGGGVYLRKTNGSVWALWGNRWVDGEKIVLNEGIVLGRDASMESEKWNSVVWCIANGGEFRAGVSEDGSIRQLPRWGKAPNSPFSGDVQIGSETGWRTVVGGFYDRIVSLKADGTLWQWNFKTAPDINPRGFSVTRFSEHSDWVGIGESGYGNGFIALAADGSLWRWRPEPTWYSRSEGIHPLLANSRRPLYLGNIFDDSQ